MKSRKVGRTDELSSSDQSLEKGDMGERSLSFCDADGQVRRGSEKEDVVSSVTGGLPRRFWSTTSVLDMAKSYSRSVMPCVLTEAEERALADLDEEEEDWEGSDCGSGSECSNIEEEEEEEDHLDGDDDDEEEESDERLSPMFPVSHSLPDMSSDVLRQRSATLPLDCQRADSGRDGFLAHTSGQRRSSGLLRGESLRRQLFQDRPLGTGTGLRRPSSIECLTEIATPADRSATTDGGQRRRPSTKPAQRHTVMVYDLPVWCLDSRAPTTTAGGAGGGAGSSKPFRRQSALSAGSTSRHSNGEVSPLVVAESSQSNGNGNGGDSSGGESAGDSPPHSPICSVSGNNSAEGKQYRTLRGARPDHRASYLMAIEDIKEPPRKASGAATKTWKALRSKFQHKDEQAASGNGGDLSSVESSSSFSRSARMQANGPPSLERYDSVFSSASNSSAEKPDDFVLMTSAKGKKGKQHGRLPSAPGVMTLSRMRLKFTKKLNQSMPSTSGATSPMSDQQSLNGDMYDDTSPMCEEPPADQNASRSSSISTCSAVQEQSSRRGSLASVESELSTSRRGSTASGEKEHSTSRRASNLMQRLASPIMVRRWKIAGAGSLDRRSSNSVPAELDMPEPPVRPFLQTFLDIEPRHIAEELTLLDAARLQRLQPSELANGAWMGKDRYNQAPNIMAMVEKFNQLALITTKEVLMPTTAEKRARAIGHFVKVAEECLKLQNFNSLKAILAGLQCTPMFRLTRTWKELSPNKNKRFIELAEMMAESKNYSEYRKRMKESLDSPPCIPFLGVFLTEIVQMDTFHKMHKRRVSRRISLKGRRMSRRSSRGRVGTDGHRRSTHRLSSSAIKHNELTRLREISQAAESSTAADGTADSPSAGGPPNGSAGGGSEELQNTAATAADVPAEIMPECSHAAGQSCSLDRLDGSIPAASSCTPVALRSSDGQERSDEAGSVVAKARPTFVSASMSGARQQLARTDSGGLASPLGSSEHHCAHDSLISEDSAYSSDYSSRAGSATFSPPSDVADDPGTAASSGTGSLPPSAERTSPLTELLDVTTGGCGSCTEPVASATPDVPASTSTDSGELQETRPEPCPVVTSEDSSTPATVPASNDETTADMNSASNGESVDGIVSRATNTLKRQVKKQQQRQPSVSPPLARHSSSSGQLRERLASAVGSIVPSPRPKRSLPSQTSVSHIGSNAITRSGMHSPKPLGLEAGATGQDEAATNGSEQKSTSAENAVAAPLESCQVTPHMPLKEQLRRYKLAASSYHHASKPWVDYLLQHYQSNTEEENYVLSCEREPKQEERKRRTWLERLRSP